MKILFVITYYRPYWTGLTQCAARVAEGLTKRGHQVTVLCSQHGKNLPLKENLNGVKVVRVKYWFKFLRSVFMPSFFVEMIKQIKDVDTVVVYLPLQEVLLVAVVTKILGKKLFLSHNGDLVLPKNCGWVCRGVEGVYFLVTLLAGKMANGILINSKDYSQNSKLLRLLEKKWIGVLPLFEMPKVNLKEINYFKKRYNLTKNVLVGYSGRFVEEKGVDFLLKAWKKVVVKYPKAILVMAGEYKISYENFWDKIKNLIEENKKQIRLLGLINDPKELSIFYKSLDVYVQPSRTDCFPNSQIEAMLSGVPSVCTNIPGARWVIKESGMGILVKPLDEEDLARGIINAIKKKAELRKHLPRVIGLFKYQNTLDKYEKIFNNA